MTASQRNDERWPLVRAVGRAAVRLLPVQNPLLFRFARKIVDRHNGDNDFAMETNGELMLARLLMPRARTVFDVGANQGEWALAMRHLNRAASIHAFEPSRETFRLLQKNTEGSGLILNEFGLGEKDEELKLWTFGTGALSNSLYRRVGTIAEPTGEESVELRTLDGYCAENRVDSIDFLKIDVEGHEVSVLRGASRMLREGRIAAIQFEYGGTYLDARTQLKDVFEVVAALSDRYSFYKLYPNRLQPVPRYTQSWETFLYSNWAVLRRDVAEMLDVPTHGVARA